MEMPEGKRISHEKIQPNNICLLNNNNTHTRACSYNNTNNLSVAILQALYTLINHKEMKTLLSLICQV